MKGYVGWKVRIKTIDNRRRAAFPLYRRFVMIGLCSKLSLSPIRFVVCMVRFVTTRETGVLVPSDRCLCCNAQAKRNRYDRIHTKLSQKLKTRKTSSVRLLLQLEFIRCVVLIPWTCFARWLLGFSFSRILRKF